MPMTPVKDMEWVKPDGQPVMTLIDGVKIRHATTQIDDRGTLCEILRPDWGFHSAPFSYVYQFTIRPGMIKGWHQHHLHDDRIFISQGTTKVVLYDPRPESPTFGIVNEIFRSDTQRSIMCIPQFVWHAHQNIGQNDVLFIIMPTRLYNHASPDVFRLPIENDVIPYKFTDLKGW